MGCSERETDFVAVRTALHFRPPFFGNMVFSVLIVNCLSIMEFLMLKGGRLFLANLGRRPEVLPISAFRILSLYV